MLIKMTMTTTNMMVMAKMLDGTDKHATLKMTTKRSKKENKKNTSYRRQS